MTKHPFLSQSRLISKRKQKALSESTIQAIMTEKCCKNHCIQRRLTKEEIVKCRKAYHSLTLVKKPPGSWRDLGGIPPGFPPGPAAILAAGISFPRCESRRNLGGITTGIPPRFWPPGFCFALRIPAGTWRELLPRFWPPGFCFLPRIPSGSWWAHSPRFWSPRFPFLAENLAKIPPRFVRLAKLTCISAGV